MAMLTATALSLIGAGAAGGASVYGSKKAGDSAKRASQVTARADDAAMEEARLEREEAKRQFDAQEAQRAKEFAASEEERVYTRRLQEEKEARQAPYRQASAAALGNLGKMLGINLSQQQQQMLAPRVPQGGELPPPPPSQRMPWDENPGPMPGQPPVASAPRLPMTLGEQVRLQPQRRLA